MVESDWGILNIEEASADKLGEQEVGYQITWFC
jgi:hypothetical protein